ncbi:bromodomain adjacent to zinc finger domain protein 1A isoform X2 [Myripristis murdjan]|uniref:bromodomain adjacent to zinc finger domain protein 1A isoform X2 n=1 Tax=Myripristis murdjan TaxID=586833 RepID=UPI001175D9D9|nr:bromodomain adjacent to zinc finger domain protein 1A isoform X2 [Myripristis murdjan]
MPLLHRKAFIRQKPPADLRPDEEVFLCKITHEIFRTYDEFFERTILCNSLVWSCALTGRAGLTYLEAVESERRARQSLQSFPSALVVPLLHLVALTRRCRLTELCDDIYAFAKDRFFPGETVDVMGRNGARHVCEILEVQSPHAGTKGAPVANGHAKPAQGDTIVISDSDDESGAPKTPKAQVNGSAGQSKKRKPLSPSAFRYSVKMMKEENSQPFTARANQISRRKNTLSRERLKLLFKQHCEPVDGTIILKPSSVAKYQLAEQTFSQFFPDEPPLFPFSPPSKGRGHGSPGQAAVAAEEKLRLLQQKEQMAAAVQEKARMKKEKEEVMEAKRREKEDKEKMKEELRRRFEEEKRRRKEEKERMKLEKEKEREKLKEEKKKYAERLKLWNKPREDMECEDLKELPCAVPVKTRLPADLFGEALMVLEFLRAFGEVFDLKDEFPDGVSLEVLEEALVGSDPEGPLCELLFFFLSAIFQALAEEQEEAKDQAEDLPETVDDDSDPTQSAISAVASLAAAWPQLHQGCSLKQLDLDSCTLSEILRLHILASGADCNHGNAKLRYQKQGGFSLTDDPCVELRLAEPALLKRLACTAVYDLTPGEKLRILQALVGKLLTLASSRDLIEDCVEEQRAARHELREIRAEQHRRGREEAAHRVRLRKEEKLREQELKLKEKEERLREQEGRSSNRAEGETGAEQQTEDEDESSSSPGSRKKTKAAEKQQQPAVTSDPKALPGRPGGLTAEELEKEQEKVRQLQQRIQQAASCTYILPLGRDRLYRRYWLLPSAGALFVEDDFFGVTEDMLQPRPPRDAAAAKMDDEEGEHSGGAGPAPVPVSRPNRWAFYSSLAEVEQLVEALNPRGHRESGLKEALLQDRERLQLLLDDSARHKYSRPDQPEAPGSVPESSSAAEALMEARLRDLLLDIEDRIYQGTLGSLKVMDRGAWRSALEAGNYELLCSDGRESAGTNGRAVAMEIDSAHLRARDRLQDVKADSGSGTPQAASGSVRCLAQALLRIELGLERKFLKPPLGDEDSKKDQKTKKSKRKDEDQASDDGSDSGRVSKTVLERWRESLQACTSLSQVFVHLSSLERSVLWSRSVLNARCRICRRKGDADNMLLCDGCDRGHHTHCLRPRLKSVPEGDWFCPDCRPKQRSSRLPSRQRSSIDEDEEVEEESEEEEDEEEEEEESEEEEEEESEEEEEEEEEVVSTKKSQPPPPKGSRSSSSRPVQATPRSQQATPRSLQATPRSQQATPRSQQATPRSQQATPRNSTASSGKSSSASKSSGKKATPSSSKPPVSGGKAPPRPGVRASARLSHEILAPNGNAKATGQNDGRKRAPTDGTPPPKPSRPVLPVLTPSSSSSSSSPSSSSSSRRSSGRGHGVHELSACEQLTVELVRHEDSWPFMKLVSRTQVPDYYDIIKKPIALSTIREKVNNCEYQTAGEFIGDVELMFSNCLQYNPRHTNEAKAGVRLQSFFHSELSRLGLSDAGPPPAKRSRM